ncbi:UDP-D-xylose:L-fucose alpha-13-D-xylosyltransferase MGP4-like, partial [Trifolium medium]|nr:UDP-D-xylose:L-fucose alpha-13-D-xylosyltransferase MGP4-like [Trifolium medium]
MLLGNVTHFVIPGSFSFFELIFAVGFFNFTARRPSHLLKILELGYSVMYNDVDMVWLADPFPYLQGDHDVYFTDDMTA